MTPQDIGHSISLPPKEAVRYLEAKNVVVTKGWRSLRDEQHARAATVANVCKADVVADIYAELSRTLRTGGTFEQWKANLIPRLQAKGWWQRDASTEQLQAAGRIDAEGVIAKGLTPSRLKTIFATNMQSAYMAGRYRQMMAQADEAPYWQYVAILDSRTRPAHRAMHGRIFKYNDPAWGAVFPPNGFRCFLPGTEIRGNVELGLKSFYSGPAVEITTAKGHRLAVTINHPVLTRRGWVQAGSLTEGDHLICDTVDVDAQFQVVVDNQQQPVLAEDLFEAGASEVFGVADVSPTDLHGDAQFVQGHVHVAVFDAALSNEGKTSLTQRVQEGLLGGADVVAGVQALRPEGTALGQAVLADLVDAQDAPDVGITGAEHGGDLAARQQRVLIERANALFELGVAVAGSLPGRTELALHERRVLLDTGPLEALGITATAQLDAANLEDAAQRVAAVAEVFGQLLETGPGKVALDHVVGVRHFDWTGHVYDFQTDSGLLFAGGILVHNCRCRVRNFTQADITKRGLTVDSSAGKLSRVQVPQADGSSMTVTRYTDPSLPGGHFQPDAGFDHASGARFPRLDKNRVVDSITPAAPKGSGGQGPVVKEASGQTTWKDLSLPDLHSVKADMPVAPELLPRAEGRSAAAVQVIAELGLKDRPWRNVDTPTGSVLLRRDYIEHVVEKEQDARERFASFILPTLTDPYEVWLTMYDDGRPRKRYIGLYKGAKYDVLVMVRQNTDGSLFWNMIPTETGRLNRLRVGKLLWGK